MRNLKRALSLLLAAAMLIGMMVVGASAVSYSDFSDKDEIVNTDAVSMLTTLGVIEGLPDGSYDPTGNVDRAQMAKMISVIMNQGADNSALYVNTVTNLTDVDSHWASGHIKYCYTNGIIAGRGNGTFDPDANVTAVEAAKMLLVAAGYDPSIEGLTGSDWALNTNALAARLGIFRNFTKDVTQPLNRDDAALLIYNALDVEMIQQYQNGYAIAYSDHRTILSAMYGVYKVEGVVLGNQYAMLDGTEYDDSMMEGKTLLAAGYRIIASTTSNTMVEDPATQRDTTFSVETPVEYLGKTVTMYIEKATILSDSKVLGVEINDAANTIITTVSNASSMKDLLKGTGVSVDRDTEYYVNYGIVADEDAANDILKVSTKDPVITNSNGIELEVIDNDNDGTAEYVLWVQEDLATITRLNDRNATLTFSFDNSKDITSYNKGKSIDLDDITLYDGAAEGDVVLVRSYGGHYYVTEPEVVTGEMEGYSNKKTSEQWIEVNGTEYRPSFINVTAADGYVEDLYVFDISKCANGNDDGVQWDITYNFYLDSNGYIAAFEPAEEVVKDYALVLDSGYEPGVIASNASGAVTVLLADGTEGSYDINFSASARNLGQQIDEDAYDADKNFGIAELKGFLGTDYTDNSTTRPWVYGAGTFTAGASDADHYKGGKAAGYVITYSMNEDDVLTITSVVGTFDSSKAGATLGNGDDNTFTSEVATGGYSGGKGTLNFNTSSTNADGTAPSGGKLAIDRDTVAFYYENSDSYGVAIGYQNMADVAATKLFMAQRVGSTNLTDVILFEAEGPQPEKDYVYILGRNDHSASGRNVTMYGIDEEGQPLTLTISRDNYEEMGLDKNPDKYDMVFAYSTNSEGVSTLSDPSAALVKTGYGLLLKNGTVAFASEANYIGPEDVGADNPTSTNYDEAYSMVDGVNIWNVTDVTENESAPAGRFATNRVVHAILILNSDEEIVTSYIWDIEEEETEEPVDPELKIISSDAANDYETPTFYIAPDSNGDQRTLGSAEMRNALTAQMKKDGCTNISWDDNKVSFDDASGNPVTKTVNFTQVYALKVDNKTVQYVAAEKVTPVAVADLTGSWYTIDGGENFDKVADVATDIAKMPANDLTIESGYYSVAAVTGTVSGSVSNYAGTITLTAPDAVQYVKAGQNITVTATATADGSSTATGATVTLTVTAGSATIDGTQTISFTAAELVSGAAKSTTISINATGAENITAISGSAS